MKYQAKLHKRPDDGDEIVGYVEVEGRYHQPIGDWLPPDVVVHEGRVFRLELVDGPYVGHPVPIITDEPVPGMEGEQVVAYYVEAVVARSEAGPRSDGFQIIDGEVFRLVPVVMTAEDLIARASGLAALADGPHGRNREWSTTGDPVRLASPDEEMPDHAAALHVGDQGDAVSNDPHRAKMADAATRYYELLDEVPAADPQRLAALKVELDELLLPYHDNPAYVAYVAFLKRKGEVATHAARAAANDADQAAVQAGWAEILAAEVHGTSRVMPLRPYSGPHTCEGVQELRMGTPAVPHAGELLSNNRRRCLGCADCSLEDLGRGG